MAPPCTFLDKLAPELRVFIYKHIFGDSEAIKKRNSTASLGIDNHQLSLNDHITVTHVPLETSILATNKLIHCEAIEVLYHNRTIRATIPEFGLMISKQDFVNHAEKVEIADCKNGFATFSSSIILQYIQTLPRMVSVVILSDCLYSVGLTDESRAWSPSYADIIPVPDFVQGMARLGHTTCVDIGRYQLHGRWCKVQIVNRRLTKMWPSTQDIPEEFDFWEDFDNVWSKWSPPGRLQDRLTLVLQSSFRCWVGFHEKLATMTLSGELFELQDQEDAETISDEDRVKLRMMRLFAFSNIYEDMLQGPHPEIRHLRHLKPGDEPRELYWATEYLSTNTAVFRSLEGMDSAELRVNILASHWAEVDGGLHSIEYVTEQQRLALAGFPTPRYLLDPVRRGKLIECDAVRRIIDAFSFDRLAQPETLNALAPLEFRRLAYLCLATVAEPQRLSLPGDAAYGRELDHWASDLLKRHLLVSDWADPKDVQDMSLKEMRDCLIALLRRPDLKEIRTEPPKDVDGDVFMPLAWKWGWEYSNTCVERLQAGREVERSSEWEDSGNEAGSGDDSEEEE